MGTNGQQQRQGVRIPRSVPRQGREEKGTGKKRGRGSFSRHQPCGTFPRPTRTTPSRKKTIRVPFSFHKNGKLCDFYCECPPPAPGTILIKPYDFQSWFSKRPCDSPPAPNCIEMRYIPDPVPIPDPRPVLFLVLAGGIILVGAGIVVQVVPVGGQVVGG